MTPEEKKEKMMQNPRVRKFVESGDEERASILISMAYILMSVANAYTEEANELMDKHGLILYNVKHTANKLAKSFDTYHNILKTMLPGRDEKDAFVEDFSILQEITDFMLEHNITVKRGDYYGATIFMPRKDNQPNVDEL